MPIHLPAHFRAWTMSDETGVALSSGNNQKSRDGIHTVAQTLPPQKYPINGGSHTVWQRRFNARVRVDKVDGPGSTNDDAKKLALRKQRIERTESIRPRIVTTGDVCLGTESRFQRNGRKPIPGLRRHRPCPDICGYESSELPKRFIVEIPARLRLSDGTREPCTDTVSHFMADTSVECSCFSIEAKIISVQCYGLCQWADPIRTPKSDCMIGGVVKEPWLVEVRSYSEAVNLPATDAASYLEAVKAQADVGALPHIDQAPRAIWKRVSPGLELT